MKNLEQFGTQEIRTEELAQIDGGNWWMVRVAYTMIKFGIDNNHVWEEAAANGVDIAPIY